MTGLLWIIHRDVVGFLYFVSTVLEEIGLNATDDYLIQKRLTHWRHLITRFQTELPAMKMSIKNFFEFVSQYQSLELAKGFIQQTLNHIDDLIEQNEKSYAALRADMALLESKRAIDQAESVGKITELGFIFIPISCIAALFSMQVQPLDTPAPLYSFVIAALLTISFIYGIRLSIRSTLLIEYKRELSRKIRLYTKLPPGAPIPARLLVFYAVKDIDFRDILFRRIWKPVGYSVLLISVLAVPVLPMAFLWLRNKRLDVGFKGMLTFVIILFVIAVMLPFIIGPIMRRLRAVQRTRSRRNTGSVFSLTVENVGHEREFGNPTRDRISRARLASEEPRRKLRSPFESERATSENGWELKISSGSWKRGLVATANWLLGKPQRRKSDTESLDSGYYTTTTVSSSDRHQAQKPSERSDGDVPRPSTAPMIEALERKRKVVRWENAIREEEHRIFETTSPRPPSHRSTLDASDSDEAYEQLTPGRTRQTKDKDNMQQELVVQQEPHTNSGRQTTADDVGQKLDIKIEPSINQGSQYSDGFDPNTAIVLYDYAANETRTNTEIIQDVAKAPEEEQSAPSEFLAAIGERPQDDAVVFYRASPSLSDYDSDSWHSEVLGEDDMGKQHAEDRNHAQDSSGDYELWIDRRGRRNEFRRVGPRPSQELDNAYEGSDPELSTARLQDHSNTPFPPAAPSPPSSPVLVPAHIEDDPSTSDALQLFSHGQRQRSSSPSETI
jgi:hypothetical protein